MLALRAVPPGPAVFFHAVQGCGRVAREHHAGGGPLRALQVVSFVLGPGAPQRRFWRQVARLACLPCPSPTCATGLAGRRHPAAACPAQKLRPSFHRGLGQWRPEAKSASPNCDDWATQRSLSKAPASRRPRPLRPVPNLGWDPRWPAGRVFRRARASAGGARSRCASRSSPSASHPR